MKKGYLKYANLKANEFIPMDELIINSCEVLQMAKRAGEKLPAIEHGECCGYRYDDGEKVPPCANCNICSIPV